MIDYKDFTPETITNGFIFSSPKTENFDSVLKRSNDWSKDKDIINVETIEYRLNHSYVSKGIRVWVKT